MTLLSRQTSQQCFDRYDSIAIYGCFCFVQGKRAYQTEFPFPCKYPVILKKCNTPLSSKRLSSKIRFGSEHLKDGNSKTRHSLRAKNLKKSLNKETFQSISHVLLCTAASKLEYYHDITLEKF